MPQPPLAKAAITDHVLDLPKDFYALNIDNDFLSILNRTKSHIIRKQFLFHGTGRAQFLFRRNRGCVYDQEGNEKQYLVKAYDGEGMLDKRMEVRPRHLEGMKALGKQIIVAGGLLDEEGRMKRFGAGDGVS